MKTITESQPKVSKQLHYSFNILVIVYFWVLEWPSPPTPPQSTSTFPGADVSLSNELGCRLAPCFQALHTPTASHSRALTQAQTLPECHFKLIKPFSHRPPLSPCISKPCFSLQSLRKLSDEGKNVWEKWQYELVRGIFLVQFRSGIIELVLSGRHLQREGFWMCTRS